MHDSFHHVPNSFLLSDNEIGLFLIPQTFFSTKLCSRKLLLSALDIFLQRRYDFIIMNLRKCIIIENDIYFLI